MCTWNFYFLPILAALFVTTKKLEMIQTPLSEWIQHSGLYPYHKILLNNKREWTTDTQNNVGEFPNNYA